MQIRKLVFAAAFAAAAQSAAAQNWPARPLTMVVPFAAGGPVDVIARIVQRRLGEVLGQQVVVENQGGAGGRPFGPNSPYQLAIA